MPMFPRFSYLSIDDFTINFVLKGVEMSMKQ